MIPRHITSYLDRHGVAYVRRSHPRAIEAQHLAEVMAESGWKVAKTVVIEADEEVWLAVLPAAEVVDTGRLASALGVDRVRILPEDQLEGLFGDCELGAEPPFGALYRRPVVMETRLTEEPRLLFRAGSHTEALEIDCIDFLELESPTIASFAVMPAYLRATAAREARV